MILAKAPGDCSGACNNSIIIRSTILLIRGVPVILESPSITPPKRMRLLNGVQVARGKLKKASVAPPQQLLLSNRWSDPVHFRRGVHIASTIALLRKKTRKVQTTHQTVPSQRLTSIQERALCRSDQYPHCLSTK